MFNLWSPKQTEPETVAAVDLGSNSFHLIVCRIKDGQLIVTDRLREMVRLAAGMDKQNNITPQAAQRALECLGRFGQRLADLPAGTVRVAGTNTLRKASNARSFITEAELRLGHPIELISGYEEARLIYLGVAHSLASDDKQRLVIDIGGSSTELIIGRGFLPQYMESIQTGCVAQYNEYFADGQISKKNLRRTELHAMQELEPVIKHYRKIGWDEVVGASGTIRSINKVVQAQKWSKDGISREALEKLLEVLKNTNHVDDLQLQELSAERKSIFPSGVSILYAIFKALNIQHMRVADGALREGLIHDFLGRIHHEDVREQSIKALANRYHVDLNQAERVASTLDYCLSKVASQWELNSESHSPWLRWSAYLFQIGLDIAHRGYHKHGAYILQNTDLAGFSQEEQNLLASLVLAHRNKFPLKVFKDLPQDWQKPAIRMAILLRLTVLLHRSQSENPLPEFTIRADSKSIELQFPDGWLSENQLTAADLDRETEFLDAASYKLLYR